MSKKGSNSSSSPHGTSSRKWHKKRIHDARGRHFFGVNPAMHPSPKVNWDSHLKQACHDKHNKVEVESSSHVPEEESSYLV